MTLHIRLPRLRHSTRRLLRASLLVLASSAGAARPASAQVPAEFAGNWVPVAAMCTSPARVRVEAARITLVDGTDTEAFGGIEMAGPSYFGPITGARARWPSPSSMATSR